jgi:hypothetical protein
LRFSAFISSDLLFDSRRSEDRDGRGARSGAARTIDWTTRRSSGREPEPPIDSCDRPTASGRPRGEAGAVMPRKIHQLAFQRIIAAVFLGLVVAVAVARFVAAAHLG